MLALLFFKEDMAYSFCLSVTQVIISVSVNQADEMAKGRVIELTPVIYLLMIKAHIIMPGGRFDGVVLWGVCLDDDIPSLNPTSSSSSYLT